MPEDSSSKAGLGTIAAFLGALAALITAVHACNPAPTPANGTDFSTRPASWIAADIDQPAVDFEGYWNNGGKGGWQLHVVQLLPTGHFVGTVSYPCYGDTHEDVLDESVSLWNSKHLTTKLPPINVPGLKITNSNKGVTVAFTVSEGEKNLLPGTWSTVDDSGKETLHRGRLVCQ